MSTTVETIEPVRLGRISMRGLENLRTKQTKIASKDYLAATAGQQGRGRKEVALLFTSDYAVDERSGQVVNEAYFSAKVGQNFLILSEPEACEDPAGWVVVWELSPGFRGNAYWAHTPNVRVLAVGHEAQGHAGRMGGADVPVVFVPYGETAVLRWLRRGRLYDTPAEWVAIWMPDALMWLVLPMEQYHQAVALGVLPQLALPEINMPSWA